MSIKKCQVHDKWWVFDGDFQVANKYSPIAVVIPTKDELGLKLQKIALESGAGIAGFVYTANIGIERIIVNILANPNIRWVIVTGHENKHKAGKALIMLWRFGIDENTKRIKCSFDKVCTEDEIPTGYIPNLPLEAIERFRKQVTVVDLLPIDQEIEEKLKSKIEYWDFTIGSKEFKNIPTLPNVIYLSRDSHWVGGGFIVFPPMIVVIEKDLPKILELIVHACIQEHENKFVREILAKYGKEFYEFYDPGTFDDKPYIIQLYKEEIIPEANVQVLDNGRIVIIEAPDIKHAYLTYKRLLESGKIGFTRPTRHGLTRDAILVEVIHYIPKFVFREENGKIIIEDFEYDEFVTKEYPLANKEYFKIYCEDVLNGVNRTGETYAYGEILRAFGKELSMKLPNAINYSLFNGFILLENVVKHVFKIDQLKLLIERIRNYPFERNHIVCFWNPIVDITGVRKAEPCIIVLDFKIIPETMELYCVCHMRSHDFIHAHIHNFYGISAIVQYIVWKLKQLEPEKFKNLKSSKLIWVITSSHMYLKQEAK